MKRHGGPATRESKVRGLLLGLALGDAIGSKGSDVPPTGMLEAGAASQLAAWTVEGLLRNATRGSLIAIEGDVGALRWAPARWAQTRGQLPARVTSPPTADGGFSSTGWLTHVPAMAERRGSSPSTLRMLEDGAPTNSWGCQGLLRALPVAGVAHPRVGVQTHIVDFAAEVVELTHRHPRSTAAVRFATTLLANCVAEPRTPAAAISHSLNCWMTPDLDPLVTEACVAGRSSPCVPAILEQVAPDRSAAAALAGGIYVALSFPEVDAVGEGLEFAGWAPDGDSVAAVAGALLGAVHGYEALPVALTSRLEIGWVMDQLARDLALELTTRQNFDAPESDFDEGGPADPWWETKYPGM